MTSYIRDLTELTAVANNDYVLISDTSDVTNKDKRISQLNLVGANITGGGTLNTGGFTLTWPASGTGTLKSGTPVAGRVASWLDANTVQDGGFGVTDIARLSVANTFTAGLIVPGIYGQSFTLATGTATSITPPISIGSFLFTTDGSAHLASALVLFRSSGSRFVQGIVSQANVAYTSGALTGSTGAAGKFTYSVHTDGKLYFENQLATTTNCRYLFVG